VNRVNVGRRQDAVEGGAHEARRSFIGGQNGRPAIIASRGVENEFPQWVTLFGRAILSEHFSCFGNQIYYYSFRSGITKDPFTQNHEITGRT
jgi:hypothetical protein